MKYILLVISIIFSNVKIFTQINSNEESLSQKQIITESMIKAAGIQTISDILYLADSWDFYTIDGYEKGLSANGLSSFQRQNFLVMLDGQLIDDRVFDVQNINQIPISIDQVDFVVFINNPQIYNGEFTENGLIDIHTKTPAKGLSLHGYNGVGEQTGKTGPYITTQFARPHVDKLGYYLSADGSYMYDNWYLATAAKTEQTFSTDAEVTSRISNLYPEYNKAKLYSSYYKLGINILGGEQQIIAGSTRHDDFFFFSPYGDEIPVNRYFKHIGINGTINTFREFAIKYEATYSLNQMNQWDNKQNISFNWQMENYYANVEGSFINSYISGSMGVGVKKVTGRDLSSSFNKSFALKKAYGNLNYKLTNDLLQSIDLFIINGNSSTALKAAFRNNWVINSKSSITANYSFSDRLLIEDANYWFWQEQGYDFSAPGFLKPDITGNYNNSKLFTADIAYSLKIDTALKIESSLIYRNFSNYYIEDQPYQFNTDNNTFMASDILLTGANLMVAGLQVGMEYRLTQYLSQKIFYKYQKDIWGSSQFRDIWHELPVHKINYAINYKPVNDFGIWLNLRYSSSTDWVNYRYSGTQSLFKYKNKVRPIFNVDLSIQKWLWNRRIWFNILFRNIFNQSENYIPIGVSSDLRFYLSGHLYFNSLL